MPGLSLLGCRPGGSRISPSMYLPESVLTDFGDECVKLNFRSTCLIQNKLAKLRRHASRVYKLRVKKVWAQLTNAPDQLSHQIGFPC